MLCWQDSFVWFARNNYSRRAVMSDESGSYEPPISRGSDGGVDGQGMYEDNVEYADGEDVAGADLVDAEDEDEFATAGGRLPIFANRENRELDEHIKDKEKSIEAINVVLKDNKDRVKIMSEHLKNVQQELSHTQQLVDAKRKEIDTESHLTQLAERETGRLRNVNSKHEGKVQDIRDKLNVIQNDIFTANDKLEKFKLQMNWNQEELEQWALAAKQKEDDNLAIERFRRADEQKIKDLTLQIEKLTVMANEKKNMLETEVTETQAKQIELDKTAEEFRALHRERQNLVRQWQDSIDMIKRRDMEVEEAALEYAEARKEKAKVKVFLESREVQLENMQQDNADIDSQLSLSDRLLQKKRDEARHVKARFEEFQSTVDLIKIELGEAGIEAEAQKTNNKHLSEGVDEAKKKLKAARERVVQVKERLAHERTETSDAELLAKGAEEQLREMESELKNVTKEVAETKELMFKQSQELYQLRQDEANMIAEISGAQAAMKNLNAKIRKLDEQSIRQQELVYNGEFQIQQLERKVSRASGVRSDEEKVVLNEKIKVCQAQLDQALDQHKMLQTQTKRLVDELKRSKADLLQSESDKETLTGRIAEMELETNSVEASHKQAVKEKEELMVQHDVLKLEVKRLRDHLSLRADEVFSLENHKFQLEMSMQERKKEIAVHTAVQRSKLKAAEEERHRVFMERNERRVKVNNLKLKYESICKATRGSDDTGEERSQAYYVIAAAQRREELQREGDELDVNIRKAEREIRALANTLSHLNRRNTDYRSSLHHADMDSRDAKDLKNLQAQEKAAMDAIFKRRKELQRLQADLEEDKRRVKQIEQEIADMDKHVAQLEEAQEEVKSEIDDQRAELDRGKRKVHDLARKHRELLGKSETEETPFEKSFRSDALRSMASNVMFTLHQLSEEFPELIDTLHSAAATNEIDVPTRAPGTAASDDPIPRSRESENFMY